ncbi:unnamed protein product [Bursaphelenchus okinawaensis]|uniref:Serpin domain-containing protein n=1 Tax=Bursaphelenchus okinawaensis TaxID=465554 RepID=A0A811K3I0_9BILA|nr:unnamed protein product [Bursaphelenchus okinawaensis]CAG9091458.1 unnamed protein product [Bursaphelenchus okinawaensis]
MSSELVQQSQLEFASRILKEVATTNPENVVVSPISILTVLSMVYSGAGNETKEEFNEVLGFNGEDEEWNKYFSSLLTAFNVKEKPYTLNSANKLFIKNGYDLKEGFKKTMEEYFGSEYEELDFNNTVESVGTINKYVEDNTNGKIKDLLEASSISDLTKLVVVNALYFKSAWVKKFNKDLTKDKNFFVKEDTAKTVKMMHQRDRFIYYDNDEYQLLGLPYAGNGVFLYIVLPQEKFGLDDLLKSLDGKKLSQIVGKRHKVEVKVDLPRFKINTKSKLNEAMKNIGLEKGFGQDPEFTEIAEERLKIDQLLHQVFIETNEEGSEAAAATGAVVNLLSAMPMEDPPTFIADHPFLFLVATKYNDILFSGVIRDF